jgi:glycosyltransferase involved in cell wall biosynthesis
MACGAPGVSAALAMPPAPVEDAPLRIAIVHASDRGGGAERSVVGLHRGLRALGHESVLYVGARHTDEPGVVEIPYVRGLPGTRRIARAAERAFGWQDIYNPSFRALEGLTKGRFDILHFNSLWGASGYADLGALPALTRATPAVVTLRENWLLTGHCACFHDCMRWRTGCGRCPDLTLAPAVARDGTAHNWKRKQRVIENSKVEIVAISDALKRDAAASPILAGKRIHRIYNGIDLGVFRPASPEHRERMRDALGILPGEVVVAMAGQTVEGIRTGIATHHAIAALNALPASLPIRVLVIGHSAQRVAGQLAHSAIALPLPFQVEPSDMAGCFQVADLCLVTSVVEAFGRIAAEAQACGTPVVAFDSGGIPEVVKHGAGGLLVPRADDAALAVALRKVVEDRPFRLRNSGLGRAHVEASFDQSDVARQYACLYRQVVERSREIAA